jgi:phosphatidylglycerol:prolipoprotein diacylglycerol transferase
VGPLPTSLRLGPFNFHLYGLGLAVAAWVAFTYGERRLRARGWNTDMWARFSNWVVVSGLVGARLAHVATNWSTYKNQPWLVVAVWQGGLASFGALAVALPIGWRLIATWWPDRSRLSFTDVLAPVLAAGWALGRFLGPQFMVAGGGHRTSQWFGWYYEGQSGRRVPVPVIQALEDGALWLLLLLLERKMPHRRSGVITATALIVWGLVRALDERFLLGQDSHSGSIGVQVAGLVMSVVGLGLLLWTKVKPVQVTE